MAEDTASHTNSLHTVSIILGFGLYWSWVYCSFNQSGSINLDLSNNPDMLWVHSLSMVMGVVTYAYMLLSWRKSESWTRTRTQILIAGGAIAVATLCYSLPLPFAVKAIGGILSGISSAFLIIFWGRLFSQMSAREVFLETVTAFLIANTIYFLLVLSGELDVASDLNTFSIRQIINAILVACMPILSAVLCWKGSHTSDGELVTSETLVIPEEEQPLRKVPWKLCIGLFIVMSVYGCVRVFVGRSDASINQSLIATVLLVFGICLFFIVCGAFLQGKRTGLGFFYKALLPILAAALLMVADFGSNSNFAGPVASMFNVAIEILSWVVLVDVVRMTSARAAFVFAAGRMCVQGGMFFGQITAWGLPLSINVFTFIGVIALMAAMGFMFNDTETEYLFEPPSQNELSHISQTAKENNESVFRDIAKNYGLTDRETEIFVLWVTGHGAKYVQDALSISQSTVKTHIRHIYEKFDVHSRADLMAVLEQKHE